MITVPWLFLPDEVSKTSNKILIIFTYTRNWLAEIGERTYTKQCKEL